MIRGKLIFSLLEEQIASKSSEQKVLKKPIQIVFDLVTVTAEKINCNPFFHYPGAEFCDFI